MYISSNLCKYFDIRKLEFIVHTQSLRTSSPILGVGKIYAPNFISDANPSAHPCKF